MLAPLNKDQEQLLKLQEKCHFSNLSAEEQAFVEKYSSKDLHDRAHAVILESKMLYEIPEPRSLAIPIRKSNRIRLVLIPISSAAAAAVLTFIFFRKESLVIQTVEKPIYLTADTVYLREKQFDTIVEYRTIRAAEKTEMDLQNPTVELNKPSENRTPIPSITSIDLKNHGSSAREDNTIKLMEGVSY